MATNHKEMNVNLIFRFPNIVGRYDLELQDTVSIIKDEKKTKIIDKFGGSIEFKTKTIESLKVT